MSGTAGTTRQRRDAPIRDGRALRADVEGLRAVAVVLVVLGDAGVPGVPGGSVGLDVFFVVSGFLVTAALLREIAATGGLSLAGVYAGRARRLLPASCLVLLATVAATHHWLGAARGAAAARDGAWAALFAANLPVAEQGTSSPLGHWWAVAVGQQFAIGWPALVALLLWLGLRHALPLVLAVLTAGSLAYAVCGQQPPGCSAATRGWEFGAGCLLALAGRHLGRIPERTGVALAGSGLALVVLAALAPPFAPVPVIGAVPVLAGRGDALLAVAPLRALGRMSFSLYLWHWPILIIASAVRGPLTPGQRAAAVLLAAGLAAVTLYGVEEPIRRSDHLRRSPMLTFGMAFLLILLPVAVARWSVATVAGHAPG